MHASRRTILLLWAFALFVGGFALASCGGDDNGEASATTATETTDTTTTTTTEPTTTTTTEPEVEEPAVVRIVVVNGAPEGGIVRESVDKGDRVVLVVTSDVADEVHLHGHEISRDVEAGGTVRIAFRATLPGPLRGGARGPRDPDRGPDRPRVTDLLTGSKVRDLPVPESFFSCGSVR